MYSYRINACCSNYENFLICADISDQAVNTLAIGLGVGLGVGIPIALTVVGIIVVLVKLL